MIGWSEGPGGAGGPPGRGPAPWRRGPRRPRRPPGRPGRSRCWWWSRKPMSSRRSLENRASTICLARLCRMGITRRSRFAVPTSSARAAACHEVEARVSIAEAAAILGLTETSVARLVREGGSADRPSGCAAASTEKKWRPSHSSGGGRGQLLAQQRRSRRDPPDQQHPRQAARPRWASARGAAREVLPIPPPTGRGHRQRARGTVAP